MLSPRDNQRNPRDIPRGVPFLEAFPVPRFFIPPFRILKIANYMFKVNNRNTRTSCEICSNRNTRTSCEICSKLTIKTPERRQWR